MQRRTFLAAGAPALLSAKAIKPGLAVRPPARVVGANDRINVGMIGVGIMGTGHLRDFARQSERDKDIQVVGVADVYSRHRERAKAIAKLTDKEVILDYRELLARPDVDAVLIATPDHWHAQMAIDAFAAGKDVYLQKPITLTLDESAQVIAAAAKYKRVLQVGSQFLSDQRWLKAKELIAEGAIGDVVWAQTTYSRNSMAGEWNYYVDEEATEQAIDWKRWIGPAPKHAFSPERFFRWRKYWEYSNGIGSDLYYHRLAPLLHAVGAGYPQRVSGGGGVYIQKDRAVPDTFGIMIEYDKWMCVIAGSMANSAANRLLPEVVYGHKGTLVVDQKGVTVTPEAGAYPRGRAPAGGAKLYEATNAQMGRMHTDDFFQCMRTRKTPRLGPELAHQVMAAMYLGVESYRDGKMQIFDPSQKKLVGKAPARKTYEGDGKNHPEGPRKQAGV